MLASGADGAASEDGAGQNNAIWSEGPWGRAAAAARTEVLQRATSPGTERGSDEGSGEHEGQWQTVRREEASNGKALSDLPALKPYWGKPAVRNFRERSGNVGIMRSPLRAFALPDQSLRPPRQPGITVRRWHFFVAARRILFAHDTDQASQIQRAIEHAIRRQVNDR